MKQKAAVVKSTPKSNGVQKSKNKQQIKPSKVAVKPTKKAGNVTKMLPPKKVIEEEEDDEEEDSGADVEQFQDDASSAEGSELLESDDDDDDEDEDDDEDDDDDEDVDEENDEEQSAINSLIDAEAAESDEDDDEEEENDNEEASSDDDEAPVEEPISKKAKSEEKGKGGIPKISRSPISSDTPDEQVIVIKNLPTKCKEMDFMQAFGKYGKIETIFRTANGSTAFIAFSSSDEATAALAANNKAQIKGNKLKVEKQKTKVKKDKKAERVQNAVEKYKSYDESKDRTVYVKYISSNTTEEQLQSHFKDCGTIESLTLKKIKTIAYAFIVFSNRSEAVAALKLNNSQLNNKSLGVFLRDGGTVAEMPENRTLVLINKNELQTVEEEKLRAIFSKCEIETIQICGKKKVLAFIILKTESGLKSALKLNGTTKNGLEIVLEEFHKLPRHTQIYIKNVPKNATEDDIRSLFSSCGEIKDLVLRTGFAIIRFENEDGYCKSFLQHGAKIQGKPIFIEPYTAQKKNVTQKRKKPMPHQGKPNAKKFKKN